MSVLSRVFRAETNIDFVSQRKRWFIVSAVLVAISLISLFGRHGIGELGLNLSIDFEGGLAIQVENTTNVTVSDVEAELSALGITGARIEELGDNAESYRVRAPYLDDARQTELVSGLAELTGVSIEETSVESVGPTFGTQIAQRALLALVVFLGVVTLFISVRFEWRMAMGALAALFHDLILTAGVYSLTGFEVTPSTVVAVLTILGYSLYDTVVVYDKIDEIVLESDEKLTYSGIVNLAMNQVLMRSINTSLTSLLPVGSMLFIGGLLLGAGTLQDFALALFVGIAAGTYSSIFVASPLLALWKEHEDQWQRVRGRIEGRPVAAPKEAQEVAAPAKKAPTLEGGSFDSRPPVSSGASPRPPKKKRRK